MKVNPVFDKLKQLYLEDAKKKYPNTPYLERTVPSYSDKNTKELTKAVIDLLKFNGYHVERTGCEGRTIDKRQTVTDILGNTRTIGSLQRVYSSSQRGTSDLKAIIKGKFIAIEIKCKATNDRQSEYQKQYQKEVEKSGGIYLIVPTFLEFYEWFTKYTEV